MTGQPHLRNVDRWRDLVDRDDLPGLHRVLTGLDRDSIEMREVSPMSDLLPEDQRREALGWPADAARPARARHLHGLPDHPAAGGDRGRLAGHLGSYDEGQLPAAATMSIEVDILPIADTDDEITRLADLIEGVAGEFSPFEELHRFSIDGVDLETAVLPHGWRARLVKLQIENTAAPAGEPRIAGWRLDKEDLLCVAKPAAFREKDRDFVAALLDAQLVNADVIAERLPAVGERHRVQVERAFAWIRSAG